jgi:formate C-acetyltransferase
MAKSQYGPNFSPALGEGKLGPTAVVNSCTKLNLKLTANSAVTDITLDPCWISGEEGLDLFVALIKSFIELGGYQVQFNIIDKKTLQEAQRNPERYKNLMVRVWGFSSYFIRLPKEYQDNLIARIGS